MGGSCAFGYNSQITGGLNRAQNSGDRSRKIVTPGQPANWKTVVPIVPKSSHCWSPSDDRAVRRCNRKPPPRLPMNRVRAKLGFIPFLVITVQLTDFENECSPFPAACQD